MQLGIRLTGMIAITVGTFTGQRYVIQAHLTDTVKDFNADLLKHTSTPVNDTRMIWDGKTLETGETLDD